LKFQIHHLAHASLPQKSVYHFITHPSSIQISHFKELKSHQTMTGQSQKTPWKPVTPNKSPQKQTRKSPRKPPTPRISARTMTIRSYTEWPISEKNKIIEWMRENLDYWKQGNTTGAAKRRRMFEDIEWDQKYNWIQT
jgi:hypothetical protein